VGPFVRYSILRLTLLVAVGLVLWAVGARGWLWLLLTAVVSFTASYVLLRLPREQVAQSLEARRRGEAPARPSRPSRTSRRIDQDAADEDAESGG
jgi:hypothetical protein